MGSRCSIDRAVRDALLAPSNQPVTKRPRGRPFRLRILGHSTAPPQDRDLEGIDVLPELRSVFDLLNKKLPAYLPISQPGNQLSDHVGELPSLRTSRGHFPC
jgi:hypothetical protein